MSSALVDEDGERQIRGGSEEELDAIRPEHVADLVGIYDHTGHPARHDGASELGRLEERALDVQVAVDQARQDEGARQVELIGTAVIPQPDDVALVDGHVGRMNLVGEDVDDPSPLQDQVRRLEPPSRHDPFAQCHRSPPELRVKSEELGYAPAFYLGVPRMESRL